MEAEGGDSKPHALYQIKSLQAVGKLNAEIGASVPSFNVFDKPGGGSNARTYTAYNPSGAPITVAFTDGFTMDVPARTQISKQGPAKAIAIRLSRGLAGRGGLYGLWNSAAYPGRYPLASASAARLYGLDGRSLRPAISGASARPGAGVWLMAPEARVSPVPR